VAKAIETPGVRAGLAVALLIAVAALEAVVRRRAWAAAAAR